MNTHAVRIDRARPLAEEPRSGHNRWHEAIPPLDHLVHDRGYDRQQAYAICSVAVDLTISELVDVPNVLVSARLPLDIFV